LRHAFMSTPNQSHHGPAMLDDLYAPAIDLLEQLTGAGPQGIDRLRMRADTVVLHGCSRASI
jgi:hypothetical protein